jgi:glucose-1-phosphate cytidylyltransferase
MKAIILAGGFGTRLSEETTLRPKPMVEIGGKPMLWHIMNICAHYGIKEFIIALGYKGECIKEYFLNFYAINNNITIDLSSGETTIHDGKQPNWKIHLIDTGLNTKTGGRLKRLENLIEENETFMFTYGDGVTDLNIHELINFHRSHGRLATVTTVRSPARFGRISFEGDHVKQFYEKSREAEGWINGGFFVLNKKAIDYIENDESVWEQEPIKNLSMEGQLMGFKHDGFWSCMDTLKEKNMLEELWKLEKAPWKIWE